MIRMDKDIINTNPIIKPYLFIKVVKCSCFKNLDGSSKREPLAKVSADIIFIGKFKISVIFKLKFIVTSPYLIYLQ